MKLPVSPDKPLCNANRPILHVAYFMKVSKDIEIPIVDADFDMCDNALEVTPPLHCPLPSTFSGYWTENHTESAGILKLFQLIKVSLSLTIMSSIDYDRPELSLHMLEYQLTVQMILAMSFCVLKEIYGIRKPL